jgi:hypothetical protein
MPYTFYSSPAVFTVPAEGTKVIQVKTLEKLDSLTLNLKTLGAYVAPKQHPTVQWEVKVENAD